MKTTMSRPIRLYAAITSLSVAGALTPAAAQQPASVVLTAAQLTASPMIQIEQTVRIDGNDQDTTKAGWVVGVTTGRNGEIYVADQKHRHISVFDRSGQFLRRFGQPGIAGELERPDRFAIAGDTVYVNDSRVISVYTTDGRFVRYITPDAAIYIDGRAAGYRHVQSLAAIPGGLVATLPGTSYTNRPTWSPVRDTTTLLRVDLGTGALPELPVDIVGEERFKVGAGGMVPRFYAPMIRFAVSRQGIVYVTGADGASIEVRDLAGKQVGRVQLDAPRRPVTTSDVDAYIARITESMLKGPPGYVRPEADRIAMTEDIRKVQAATQHAIIGQFLVGDNGELLIERADLSTQPPGARVPTLWDYLDEAGKLVGRVEFPAGFKPMTFSRDVVNGMTSDDKNVHAVVQYKLRLNGAR